MNVVLEGYRKLNLALMEALKNDAINEFCQYQIKWLTEHCDIEFCPEEEALIIRFLQDTAESFKRENKINES